MLMAGRVGHKQKLVVGGISGSDNDDDRGCTVGGEMVEVMATDMTV